MRNICFFYFLNMNSEIKKKRNICVNGAAQKLQRLKKNRSWRNIIFRVPELTMVSQLQTIKVFIVAQFSFISVKHLHVYILMLVTCIKHGDRRGVSVSVRSTCSGLLDLPSKACYAWYIHLRIFRPLNQIMFQSRNHCRRNTLIMRDLHKADS